MSNVFGTFEAAVSNIVDQIHSGGATVSEFDIDGLANFLIRQTDNGFVINSGVSFWVAAEDFAV